MYPRIETLTCNRKNSKSLKLHEFLNEKMIYYNFMDAMYKI